MGRTAFRSRWRGFDATDRIVVDAALDRLDLTELRDRHWKTLSGGEKQRAHIAILVALHDLSLAARFCDHLVLMNQGSVVATGPPQEVLTAARLRDVFEVDAQIGKDGLGNLAVAYY